MLSPDILNVFTQAMDTERLVISGTERGNVEVEVHPQFGLIGTANPGYIGTIQLGRAVERRFGRGLGYVEMDFLSPDEESASLERELELDAALLRGRACVRSTARPPGSPSSPIGSATTRRSAKRSLPASPLARSSTGSGPRASPAESARCRRAAAMFTLAPPRLGTRRWTRSRPSSTGRDRIRRRRPSSRRRRVAWPTIRARERVADRRDTVARPRRPTSTGPSCLHRSQVSGGSARRDPGPGRRGRAPPRRPPIRPRDTTPIYDREGRQVTDHGRVDAVEGELRERYGVERPARDRSGFARPSELLRSSRRRRSVTSRWRRRRW